jgi:YD repeat-containing protein
MDGGRARWFYNEKGQLWYEDDEELRRKGQRIGYEYDGFSRVVRIDYPESEDTVYEYGGPGDTGKRQAGRVKEVRDESGSIQYEYGWLGEVTGERRVIRRRNGGGA